MIKFLLKYKYRIIAFTAIFVILLAGLVIVAEKGNNEEKPSIVQSSSKPKSQTVEDTIGEAASDKEDIVHLKEAKIDVRATNEPVDVKTGKLKRPKANAQTCTMIVKCVDVLQNPQMLNPQKASIIPENGIIYHTEYAEFHDGETVFDVFKREMKQQKLHFDYEESVTTGAFVSGIGNLYNGDCGANSGWMYYVNGEMPQTGCSQHVISGGDLIEWIYICDMNKLF